MKAHQQKRTQQRKQEATQRKAEASYEKRVLAASAKPTASKPGRIRHSSMRTALRGSLVGGALALFLIVVGPWLTSFLDTTPDAHILAAVGVAAQSDALSQQPSTGNSSEGVLQSGSGTSRGAQRTVAKPSTSGERDQPSTASTDKQAAATDEGGARQQAAAEMERAAQAKADALAAKAAATKKRKEIASMTAAARAKRAKATKAASAASRAGAAATKAAATAEKAAAEQVKAETAATEAAAEAVAAEAASEAALHEAVAAGLMPPSSA